MSNSILIIDDDPINLRVLCSCFEDHYDLRATTSAKQGLKLVDDSAPDLILLDVVMPEMDGYQVLSFLKSDPKTCDIPVIFITARHDAANETRALHSGAADFIHKPINPPVVRARARLQLELRQRMYDLQQALEQLKFLSHHDPLTGLPNRSWFLECTEQALALAKRQQRQLALLFLDLDKFKPVNDRYGHAVGDALLKQVAQRMCDSVRASDIVGRMGGDEFVLLLQDIESAGVACQVAEKIRLVLNQSFVLDDAHTVFVGATIGLAIYPDHATSTEELIQQADKAMYQAKQAGRNCVHLFQPPSGALSK